MDRKGLLGQAIIKLPDLHDKVPGRRDIHPSDSAVILHKGGEEPGKRRGIMAIKKGNIKSIDHMVITTAELEACLYFYEGLLGMEHRIEGGQHTLHFGDQKINLHTRPHEFYPSATNVTHGSQDFCFIADGDIQGIKKELTEAGIEIFEGVVERYGARGLMDSIYMYDPDGNLVEIAVYKTEEDFDDADEGIHDPCLRFQR